MGAATTGVLVGLVAWGVVWRLGWPLARYVVADASMQPTLLPGDRVLVLGRRWWARAPRPGAVVVARDPEQPGRCLIKRLAGVSSRGAYILLGDNPALSRDSRVFGPLPRGLLVGRVIWRYLPGERRGVPGGQGAG